MVRGFVFPSAAATERVSLQPSEVNPPCRLVNSQAHANKPFWMDSELSDISDSKIPFSLQVEKDVFPIATFVALEMP